MFPDMEEKYKAYLAYFNDKNTVLHNGEDCVEQGDKDMRNSMLMTVFLCLSAAYI